MRLTRLTNLSVTAYLVKMLEARFVHSSVNITLTPQFDKFGHAESLIVNQVFHNLSFSTGDAFFSLITNLTNLDVGYIDSDGLEASDDLGPLQYTEKSGCGAPPVVSRQWITGRDTKGAISLAYTALPRPVSNATKNGPALDFRKDQGGLIGSGFGFLGVPPISGSKIYAAVSWDLSNSPEGTRASWSLAEASKLSQSATGEIHIDEVQSSFFAVGPLNSLSTIDRPGTTRDFDMYWFGEPPFDAALLGSETSALFRKMQAFFSDKGKTYRVFVRRNPHPGTMTGTALTRSFMFAYDASDFTEDRPLGAREGVLAHEMVHNWVIVEDESGLDNWYMEGFAEYYSVLLRYRLGVLSFQQYIEIVNEKLDAYYTGPLVNASLEDVAKLTWKLSHAQRVPYFRDSHSLCLSMDCCLVATRAKFPLMTPSSLWWIESKQAVGQLSLTILPCYLSIWAKTRSMSCIPI